ncbi:MAG TPA: NADP(H)-dependent aldo-keto reductase [Gammaproteobacteria bacterium]|nr:NADP(H)-dependent aldo-keto reductase [Gammaproteobacteria bacterium]
MDYRQLGHTEVRVSVVGLGTMTWGEQNDEAEAFAQMDYAVEHGVNFFDTAELYAIPPCAETCGRTEEIIGKWLRARGKRDAIILASKIAGPGPDWIPHIRDGRTVFDAKNLTAAVDASLRRLQSDYIDLYQLHWPERDTNFFGRLGYDAGEPDAFTPVRETLEALQSLVDAGKIRHFGLSNETPWGVMSFLKVAEQHDLPRPVSVQNPYSLLNRTFEVGLAEIALREHCGLLAYSPLGFGVLSGKYLDGQQPEGARLTRWPDYARYSSDEGVAATREYVQLARTHDLDPAQMALAWCHSRPFLTSTLIGATSMEQLASNIASADLVLPPEVIEGIEDIHRRIPNPSP